MWESAATCWLLQNFFGGEYHSCDGASCSSILAMQSAVRPARAGLMMEIQLAVPPATGQWKLVWRQKIQSYHSYHIYYRYILSHWQLLWAQTDFCLKKLRKRWQRIIYYLTRHKLVWRCWIKLCSQQRYHKTKPDPNSPNIAAGFASQLRTTDVHVCPSLLHRGDLVEHSSTDRQIRTDCGACLSSLEHKHVAWHKSLGQHLLWTTGESLLSFLPMLRWNIFSFFTKTVVTPGKSL